MKKKNLCLLISCMVMAIGATAVKRPAKCEKFLCQKSYSFQGFQPFLTKELNCEK